MPSQQDHSTTIRMLGIAYICARYIWNYCEDIELTPKKLAKPPPLVPPRFLEVQSEDFISLSKGGEKCILESSSSIKVAQTL